MAAESALWTLLLLLWLHCSSPQKATGISGGASCAGQVAGNLTSLWAPPLLLLLHASFHSSPQRPPSRGVSCATQAAGHSELAVSTSTATRQLPQQPEADRARELVPEPGHLHLPKAPLALRHLAGNTADMTHTSGGYTHIIRIYSPRDQEAHTIQTRQAMRAHCSGSSAKDCSRHDSKKQ
jgi:hypothetical protein